MIDWKKKKWEELGIQSNKALSQYRRIRLGIPHLPFKIIVLLQEIGSKTQRLLDQHHNRYKSTKMMQKEDVDGAASDYILN